MTSTATAYLPEADAVPAGPPPPSRLSWAGATPEQLAFMQEVYRRHVAKGARRRRFVGGIPRTELGEIERGIYMRRAAAAEARQLLAQARQDWRADRARGDPKALGQGQPGLNNAYRSPGEQFVIWQRNFPGYYKETAGLRRRARGGEHGAAAADRLVDYVGRWVAAPGYSLHQNGLAMDLAGGSLRISRKGGRRQSWRQSWYWDWLGRNAARYHFRQNTSIDEPWHWEYFGQVPAGPAVPPGPAGIARPGKAPVNFLAVDQVPALASHRGRPPAVVIGWNAVGSRTTTVDVVIHFHGFSPREGRMQLQQDMLPVSGLDFSDPAGSGAPGRTGPTIYVLPRGSHAGGIRYLFPAMERPGTVRQLVDLALDQVRARLGAPGLRLGRLIFTAHSGGGAGLLAALAHSDPDEVHVFDGLYQPADQLIRWASARIRCEQAACGKPRAAMRVIYLRGSKKTTHYSGLVRKALQPRLDAAPALAADLKRRYRVEETTVPHMDIPRTFGWRLLADAAADLPLLRGSAPASGHSGKAGRLSPRAFYRRYIAFARATEAADGVPALFTLAQSAVETGWGASAPGNMMFGVKAKPSDPPEHRQLLRTREVLKTPNARFPEVISVTPRPDGRYDYVVRDWFRKYDSPEDSFRDHALLLKRRFASAFTFAPDPYGFAKEVARKGYATAPNYFQALSAAISTLKRIQATEGG